MTVPPLDEFDSNELQSLIEFLYRSPVGLIDLEADGTIGMMNPMAAQLLMPLTQSGHLANLFEVLDALMPDLRELASRPAGPRRVLCEGRRLQLASRPAGQQPGVLSFSLFKGEAGRLAAVVHDATQDERRQRRRIERAASTDGLTGLANRHALHAYLAARLNAQGLGAREMVVLFVNCDRFQHLNDALGHTAGDAVLAQLARRLPEMLAGAGTASPSADDSGMAPLELAVAQDGLAARIGNDEFVLAVERDRRPGLAKALAMELMRILEPPYVMDGTAWRCPVSIGIACASERSEAPGDLLYHARLAMVAAKAAGGGRFHEFDDALERRARERSTIEHDLRRAVEVGELFVAYQPVVRLDTGRLEAVEALVRWQHPVRGLVSPADFIGIAEEAGLIVEIGAFVLRTACRQFMRWTAQHGDRAPTLLAVNLSRGQLPHPSLVEDVANVLRETGMPPEQLQLEVTESMAAQDNAVQSRLRELKRLGLTLALDDFGTGYSSLASLYQLPVDVLKIDRSFVSQLETSEHHRVLVEATLRVAHSLDFRTVAEGIETPEQAALLTDMRCDKGQGYHFARPLAVEQFDAWVLNQS